MRVLLFDLDDTLVPSTQAYDIAMRAIGISPTDSQFLQARADVKHICPKGYPAARSRRLYFKRYLEITERFTPHRHVELATAYESEVVKHLAHCWQQLHRAELFNSLRPLVDKIGIVSNETTTLQSAKLAAFDPEWKYFDFVVTSEELGAEKPARVMFTRAIELAGAHVQDCTFIGDNYECDILGSTALGMRAIQTLEFISGERQHTKTIAKLDDLLAVLRA
jgi:HAD superfamily hydrolase (TIGR01549 family)